MKFHWKFFGADFFLQPPDVKMQWKDVRSLPNGAPLCLVYNDGITDSVSKYWTNMSLSLVSIHSNIERWKDVKMDNQKKWKHVAQRAILLIVFLNTHTFAYTSNETRNEDTRTPFHSCSVFLTPRPPSHLVSIDNLTSAGISCKHHNNHVVRVFEWEFVKLFKHFTSIRFNMDLRCFIIILMGFDAKLWRTNSNEPNLCKIKTENLLVKRTWGCMFCNLVGDRKRSDIFCIAFFAVVVKVHSEPQNISDLWKRSSQDQLWRNCQNSLLIKWCVLAEYNLLN